MDVKISPGWKKALSNEFKKEYFLGIVELLKNEITSKQVIYPAGPLIFNAFNTTDLKDVKVVIIGQDPYHGPNQAHGLSFSVQKASSLPLRWSIFTRKLKLTLVSRCLAIMETLPNGPNKEFCC